MLPVNTANYWELELVKKWYTLQCKKEAKKISSFFEGLPAKLENLKHPTSFFFPLSLAHDKKDRETKEREKI